MFLGFILKPKEKTLFIGSIVTVFTMLDDYDENHMIIRIQLADISSSYFTASLLNSSVAVFQRNSSSVTSVY
jgi:hypothetical protein